MSLCLLTLSCLAAAEDHSVCPVPVALMEPGEGCRAGNALDYPMLRFADSFGEACLIAPPSEGQDRDEWVATLHAYKDAVIEGNQGNAALMFTYDGVRAWARLGLDTARAIAPRPGDAFILQAEARRVSGNPELCLAFDIHDAVTDMKTGWTGVLATGQVPQDGAWHTVTLRAVIPDSVDSAVWLRPILGFDATRNPDPGEMHVRALALSAGNAEQMSRFERLVRAAEAAPARLDFSAYDRPDLRWLSRTFSCHFTFMYDRSFFDPESGAYTVESFLEEGVREFGGYDSVLLWHAYPRIGLDDRNQFDFYRDMPGGLAGVRDAVDRLHAHGVKVFINYNPWDRATRRESVSDEEALADMIAALDADGIYLDTMLASSPELRNYVDKRREGVAFVPEIHPKTKDITTLTGSWAQYPPVPFAPAMPHHKWIEPRHMQYQIKRWNSMYPGTDHAEEVETAFFNGSGMMIWENVFGAGNPWRAGDRATWRRAIAVLRAFPEWFSSTEWDPFYPTLVPELHAHRWPGDGMELFTLANKGSALTNARLFSVPWSDGMECHDAWTGRPMDFERDGANAIAKGDVQALGCVAVLRGQRPESLDMLLERQRDVGGINPTEPDLHCAKKPVVSPDPVERTPFWNSDLPPKGMVRVDPATLTMRLEHVRRECGCYPDPGVPEEKWVDYLQGWEHHLPMTHEAGPFEIPAFYMDEAEVTNAEFDVFLRATGYQPEHAMNFLKHWPGGRMPEEIANHPVVYVDINDARAYARWAGKRLPREEEWHLAAQGTDGRKWPWGMEYDEARVNMSGATMPVRSLPEGRSPFGCYHMSGNVWELTESMRDDGRTRFLILRGGSFFDPNRDPQTASIWYFDGGPRPCDHHAKQILMWPGLDRCATVGFRCVVDTAAP